MVTDKDLLDALVALLAHAERREVLVDSECGDLRSLSELEADGELPGEILTARSVIAKAKGGE